MKAHSYETSYVDLITRVIAPVVKDRSSFVEVKADREKMYNETLHAAIGKTIFNNTCSSVSREKSDLIVRVPRDLTPYVGSTSSTRKPRKTGSSTRGAPLKCGIARIGTV